MLNEFSRTELLIGNQAIKKIKESTVAIFGIGGVGTFCVEALARSGIGNLILIDDDNICLTNINRQLIATHKTLGEPKVEIMKQRVLDINPNANVKTYKTFYTSENADEIDLTNCDYIVDAIDTVSSKLYLIQQAQNKNINIISCMGAGNKLDPTMFEVSDIYKTSVCPLARTMRYELRKRGIKKLKVVYSKEPALKPTNNDENSCKQGCICSPNSPKNCSSRRQIPGSVAFVPSVAGLIIAGEVIKDIAFKETK